MIANQIEMFTAKPIDPCKKARKITSPQRHRPNSQNHSRILSQSFPRTK
uniref:Uncharacterized protein n=1 Tax=Arundo donax TaxID=35708 RepID=A0A0A9B1B3_ARUDO